MHMFSAVTREKVNYFQLWWCCRRLRELASVKRQDVGAQYFVIIQTSHLKLRYLIIKKY